jgi:hypothetical protein
MCDMFSVFLRARKKKEKKRQGEGERAKRYRERKSPYKNAGNMAHMSQPLITYW